MSKKQVELSKTVGGALKHNPFASLARSTVPRGAQTTETDVPAPACVAPQVRPARPSTPRKVTLRHETKGRSGKVVTRIQGLPSENLEAIASRLRKALGCGGTIEGEDLLLLGTLKERASEWLERAGDLRAIMDERRMPALADARSSAEAAPRSAASAASGANRSDVHPGQRVAIVLKADQLSGTLTEGIVRDLLTSSATHPRGIKVRLESGQVGRVKIIYA